MPFTRYRVRCRWARYAVGRDDRLKTYGDVEKLTTCQVDFVTKPSAAAEYCSRECVNAHRARRVAERILPASQ
jgi:hypothetical protein